MQIARGRFRDIVPGSTKSRRCRYDTLYSDLLSLGIIIRAHYQITELGR